LAQVLGRLPEKLDDPSILVGFNTSDDAAAIRLDQNQPDDILLQSVDFITPIVDDPFIFGQIAAANALSDIYAMGGRPLFALNIVGFPKDELPLETLSDILAGGIDKAHEAGIHVLGGHTVDDREPKYGMVVTGTVKEANMMRNSTAKPGDLLVLTKPLGTGIIATATKRGVVQDESLAESIASMITLNKSASEIALNVGVNAITDVTGYGLLGHLLEMCKPNNLSAELSFNKIPFFKNVKNLASEDVVPSGSKRNLDYVRPHLDLSGQLNNVHALLAADAQTSGGLLLAVGEHRVDQLVEELEAAGTPAAAVIGTLSASDESRIALNS